MPSPIAVPVKTSPSQLWSGKQSGINTLLLMNTDITNTVMVGNNINTLVVPIAPNGSLSVDPASNWYVVGAVAGIAPLVVVPNGQANFLGITAGLGKLVIPAIMSPNFITSVSGWSINKDGSAEFNNLTIRGTFFGTNYIINNSGIFFYSGVPALGNLLISISNAIGPDQFGNSYSVGIFFHNGAATIGMVTVGGLPILDMNPSGRAHGTNNAQIFAALQNGGLANEVIDVILTSGKEGGDDAALQLFSDSFDATIKALAIIEFGGQVEAFFAKGQGIRPAQPGTAAVIEGWHNMALANSWANNAGFGVARYRFLASPANTVEIDGVIDATAATAGTFFTLPVGWRPGSNKGYGVGSSGGAIAGSIPNVRCTTAGGLSINNATVPSASSFFIHGFINLDA